MASIDKRVSKSGAITYRVRWREGGTREGEWQCASFPPPARKRDAELFKARVDACGQHWPADATGSVSAPGVITLKALADEYLADRDKRVRSDRTAADYRRDYTNWIEPTFGKDTMIDTITKKDVKAWVDGMADGTITRPGRTTPLAPKSVVDRFILLSSMFKYAADEERAYVDRNPCKD